MAAKWDDPEILKILIDAGSDVNIPNDMGQTPLFKRGVSYDIEITKLLIAARADLNKPDDYNGKLHCKFVQLRLASKKPKTVMA